MPFFYVAAGGTIVLAVRLALRFLRRNNEDDFKDDLFFTDDDAGASTVALLSGARDFGHIGATPKPAHRGRNSGLPVQRTLGNDVDAALPSQLWPVDEENLQVVSGVPSNPHHRKFPDFSSVSVSSSEARRRAASVLKVRNWDDTGAEQDWGLDAGSPGDSSGGSGSSGSGDDHPRLTAAESKSSTASSSRCAARIFSTEAEDGGDDGGEAPAAAEATHEGASVLAPGRRPQQLPAVFEGVDASRSRGLGLEGVDLPLVGVLQSGEAGGLPLTVASSMVGNCSRNSGTDTCSVPLRSCGTGTGTVSSSSSPDTSQTELHEHRSETDSERLLNKANKGPEQADKPKKDWDAGDQARASLAAEVVAAGRSERVEAAAAGTESVIVASAAVAPVEDAASSLGAAHGLPPALWAPASPTVPEPLPLPPTILETRSPDPRALLAIQQQVEALRLQHLQRQAQSLLTAPAASRAAPLQQSPGSSPGDRTLGPAGSPSPLQFAAVAVAPRPAGSPPRSTGVHASGGGAVGGGLRARAAGDSLPSSPETTMMGMVTLPPGSSMVSNLNPAMGSVLPNMRSYGDRSSSGMGEGAGPTGWGANPGVGARPQMDMRQQPGNSSRAGGGLGDTPKPTGSGPGSVLSDDLLQQLIQRPSGSGIQPQQQPQQQQDLTFHAFNGPLSAARDVSRQRQWPDAAVQAARMGTLQLEPRQSYQQLPQQLQQQMSIQGQLQGPPQAARGVSPSGLRPQLPLQHQHQHQQPEVGMRAGQPLMASAASAWQAARPSANSPGVADEQHVPFLRPPSQPSGQALAPPGQRPPAGAPVQSHQQQLHQQQQVVQAATGDGATGVAALPGVPVHNGRSRNPPFASQENQAPQPGQTLGHWHSLEHPHHASVQAGLLHHAASVPHTSAVGLAPAGLEQRTQGIGGVHTGMEHRPQPQAGRASAPGELTLSPRGPPLWPGTAAGMQQGEITAVAGRNPVLHDSPERRQMQGHGHGHPRGDGHGQHPVVLDSPPRVAGTPTPSTELLLSPPSFRHHLRHGESVLESESARRTQDWINSTSGRMDGPVSPTLRSPLPAAPAPAPAAAESSPGITLRVEPSPSRLQPSPSRLQLSPSHRQSSTRRMRHQDTLESNRSGGDDMAGSSHGSRRHGSTSRRKRMEQQLLQQKLSNQPAPSPLALFSASLLHQAGEKLVPAPRMPGSGRAFFVPLKHELRLDISSRIESSAVSLSQDGVDSPYTATTGFGEVQASYASATTAGAGPQPSPSSVVASGMRMS